MALIRRPPPIFYDLFVVVLMTVLLVSGYLLGYPWMTGHDLVILVLGISGIRAGISGAKLGLFGALGERDRSSDHPPPSDSDGGASAGSRRERGRRGDPPEPPPTSAVLAIARYLSVFRPRAMVATVAIVALLVMSAFR